MSDVRHILRYGIPAENDEVQRFRDQFDVLVVNGNVAAWMSAGLTRFLVEKLGEKPYFLDPLTHAFQHDLGHIMTEDSEGRSGIKASIQRLIEAYGDPIATIVGKELRSLVPSDLSDPSMRSGFAKRVIKFQKDLIYQEASESGDLEMLQFAGLTENIRPWCLVAPYFYMTASTWEDWLPHNAAMVKEAADASNHDDLLYAQLVMSKDLLATDLKKIADAYAGMPCEGVMIWVDDFDETSVGDRLLGPFAELCRLIKNGGKSVLNLYGSYFSVLLTHRELDLLDGVCHGPEYGESRPVVPVGGGIPVAKFYYPPLHTRVRYADAVRILRAHGLLDAEPSRYFAEVCPCPECKRIVRQDVSEDFAQYGISDSTTFRRSGRLVTLEYPTQETKIHCLRHYLYNKEREYALEADLETVLSTLKSTAKALRGIVSTESVGHLTTWASCLEKLT